MHQQISQPLEIFSMNDQPFTCSQCGARCEELASFYHTNAKSFVQKCFNDQCGFICFQEMKNLLHRGKYKLTILKSLLSFFYSQIQTAFSNETDESLFLSDTISNFINSSTGHLKRETGNPGCELSKGW